MPDDAIGHVPVLPDEVITLLKPGPGQRMLDCTLGRGGHAALLIPLMPGGTYDAVDLDADNASFAQNRLAPIAEANDVTLNIIHASFAQIVAERATHSTTGGPRYDMVLADLGFASNQMDDPDRGFSFQGDGPLDMRLDASSGVTAAELVNTLGEKELADLIYGYGEERLSRRIARKIVDRRGDSPIQTTVELAELCRRAYGPRASSSRIHPATRTFMALRIAVNGELDALDGLLRGLPKILNPGARAGIISFHSLEDRKVKQAFLSYQQNDLAERLTRKPITANADEIVVNPRSRSAKLRGIRSLGPADQPPFHTRPGGARSD